MDRMVGILDGSSSRRRDRSQGCYHDLIDVWRNWPHWEMLNADTTFSVRKFREKGDIEPAYAKLSEPNELFWFFPTIPGLNGWVGWRYADYRRQPRWYHLTSRDMIWRGWSFGLRKQMLSHSDQIDRYVSIRLHVCNRHLSIPHDKLRRVVLHPPAPDSVTYVTTGNLANECIAKIIEALIAFKMLLLSN